MESSGNKILGGLVSFHVPTDYEGRIRLSLRIILFFAGLVFLYLYSNKFLAMCVDYISQMARDIKISGVQMNPSHMPVEKLTLIVGGMTLVAYLLVQNDFAKVSHFLKSPDNNKSFKIQWISPSLFGIVMFIIGFILVVFIFDLSPGSQTPFLFLGGAIVSGIILLQNNLTDIFDGSAFKTTAGQIQAGITLGSIIIFAGLTLNISFIPIISQNISQVLSVLIVLIVGVWMIILRQELDKPDVQQKRTAAMAYLVLLPFLMYLLLRVFYLQNDPDPVMANRWEVKFDFMDKVNTFKINPWPMEVEPNVDSRWLFLKAAIINSVRVTLVSIVLCTILGIIVGVTRLSSNKLAASVGTVYVEVFRNLPAAVLLFLIATQIGFKFPYFIDEESILPIGDSMAAMYYSNEGIWFVTVSDYSRLLFALIGLAVLRAVMRHRSRVEPRFISRPDSLFGFIRRPFSFLGWRFEPLVADLFLIFSSIIFLILFVPFITTHGGGWNGLIGIFVILYGLYITTSIDDDGMNSLEIDDSEKGVRTSFTIWTLAFSFAAGITLSGGLSFPEYTKDWNNDGIIDAPGSWDIVEGTGFEITPFFLAMIIGLTLFTAAVVAEIVRGSIQSLPRGQVEAAISLSLNPYQRLRLVILPQALRSMVPLLNNQYMNVWKNSSLALIVAYTDIFYVILVMMNNVGKLIPLFILLLITYQFGSLTISAIMNWYNSRVTSVKI